MSGDIYDISANTHGSYYNCVPKRLSSLVKFIRYKMRGSEDLDFKDILMKKDTKRKMDKARRLWDIYDISTNTHGSYYKWRSSYGFSYPVFANLLDHLKHHILHTNLSLPPNYAFSMVLSYLSYSLSTKTLAHCYSLDPYLVSKFTNMVTHLFATKLYPEYLKIPISHFLLQIIYAFRNLTALPNIHCSITKLLCTSRAKVHTLISYSSDGRNYSATIKKTLTSSFHGETPMANA
ncbi:hypothetical protein Scep_012245 [Stephania cephalantha]|uniref:Uncharacterized protein n=1 Tax=Stephania cephalantha TaxID=152367 RepID=A0AAP0JF81_9MAGN